MWSKEDIKFKVFSNISKILEDKTLIITDDMPLFGENGVLDSMRLVELCLALEDMAMEMNFEFDWTSEVALSRSRSMFRTAGSLAAEFYSQAETVK